MRWPVPVSATRIAIRAAGGAAISLALAHALELAYPMYAMIAAVIVTDLSTSQTQQLALRRLVATAVGAACGALLSPLLLPAPWSVGLGILAAMLLCYLIGANEGAKVAGYTCGIVVLAHRNDEWSYAFYRFVETALGVIVAWLISKVPALIQES